MRCISNGQDIKDEHMDSFLQSTSGDWIPHSHLISTSMYKSDTSLSSTHGENPSVTLPSAQGSTSSTYPFTSSTYPSTFETSFIKNELEYVSEGSCEEISQGDSNILPQASTYALSIREPESESVWQEPSQDF